MFAQADVEVTFLLPSLDNAEQFDASWVDAQELCGQKGSNLQGGVGAIWAVDISFRKSRGIHSCLL